MSDNDLTIDTNVFEHLFNPQENVGAHIDTLLGRLVERGMVLCADKKGRIFAEYDNRLKPLFKAMSDQGQRLFWLRYFLVNTQPHLAAVDFGDALMVSIRRSIGFAEPSDHVFVYVAISSDSILVSNNPRHITDHRNRLRRCATRHGSGTTDFVNSSDALVALGG